MGKIKEINIKNQTLFLQRHGQSQNFWIKLKIDKNYHKGIDIYYIGYITIKKIDDCENIHSVNPLYLLVNHASGYIEEKNGNKYLIFDDSVNKNKELLKKYPNIWDEIKNEIKTINGGKENDYGKDCMKIDLILSNKPLKFPTLTINIRCVLKEGEKLCPLIYLDECLYEL